MHGPDFFGFRFNYEIRFSGECMLSYLFNSTVLSTLRNEICRH